MFSLRTCPNVVLVGAVLAVLPDSSTAGGPPCEADVRVVFQAEPRGSSPVLFDGAVEEVDIVVPSNTPVARHTVAAALVSQLAAGQDGGGQLCRGLDCNGVQGWSSQSASGVS